MSFESRRINNEYDNSTVKYKRDPHFGITVYQISSMLPRIQQLQTDLQQQHEYDKDTLDELNQRLYTLIHQIQFLQSENLKYLTIITQIRQQTSDYDTTKIEEDCSLFWSTILSISDEKIDYDWDYQMFQLHIGIYQHLISIEDQSKTNEILSLEKEVNHSTSILSTLRTSYEQLQQELDSLSRQNDDLTKEYFRFTTELCHLKNKQKKSQFKIHKIKDYITFYQNLRLYTTEDSRSLSRDMEQFLRIDTNQLLQRIRQDFESFYSNLYQQMMEYYQTKTNELQTNFNQISAYQQNQYEQHTFIQNKLQREYQIIEKDLIYEKEIFNNLESMFSKLSTDFQELQRHHDEELQRQSNELYNLQAGIMAVAYDVDEVRRRKTDLQVELIIYRQLLNASGIGLPVMIVHRIQPNGDGTRQKYVVKRKRKRSIGINCAPNGTYIGLMNFSKNKIIDLSKWFLTQYIDTKIKIFYKIPDGIQIEAGRELRIYTKLNENINTSGTIPYRILIHEEINSWGQGNVIKTYLYNQNGDEEASYKQMRL